MTAFPFDDVYLGPEFHVRPDDLGPSDEDDDRDDEEDVFAMSRFDPNGGWLDA